MCDQCIVIIDAICVVKVLRVERTDVTVETVWILAAWIVCLMLDTSMLLFIQFVTLPKCFILKLSQDCN